MRWILTQRKIASTTITTLWDTSLFRFYELKVKDDDVSLSTGHANFRGDEAKDFWLQLSAVVAETPTPLVDTDGHTTIHRLKARIMLKELPDATTDS